MRLVGSQGASELVRQLTIFDIYIYIHVFMYPLVYL